MAVNRLPENPKHPFYRFDVQTHLALDAESWRAKHELVKQVCKSVERNAQPFQWRCCKVSKLLATTPTLELATIQTVNPLPETTRWTMPTAMPSNGTKIGPCNRTTFKQRKKLFFPHKTLTPPLNKWWRYLSHYHILLHDQHMQGVEVV
jgi:hypothetical protein